MVELWQKIYENARANILMRDIKEKKEWIIEWNEIFSTNIDSIQDEY